MDVTGRLPGSPPCHPGVAVRVAADRVFGPLVLFGLSGVAAELFEDQAARLTPLTDTDVDTLVRSVRAAPLLLGCRAGPRPTWTRSATCCYAWPAWPTTSPRSPTST